MSGWVYCIENPSLHDVDGTPLYKVGFTRRESVEIRMDELYRGSGVPTPFHLVSKRWVDIKKEKMIHKVLDDYRVNPNREFFRCNVSKIETLFDLMEEKNTKVRVTMNHHQNKKRIIKEEKCRRSKRLRLG
jgi:hypothetical protein